jgi:hypothetical protein
MAFSILVELNQKDTDWKSINKELKETSNGVIEIFPIPKFPKTNRDNIGISIPNRNLTVEDFESIKKSIKFFLQGEHKVIELYSSSEFTMENVDMLTDKFFKPKG